MKSVSTAHPPLPVVAVRPLRPGDPLPFDLVLLTWAERRGGGGVFECVHGDRVAIARETGALDDRARLILADGRHVEVIAAEEDLAEVSGPGLLRYEGHLRQLGRAWQREPARLLIPRDPAVEDALRRLGASVRHVSEPFEPNAG